jgi:hypothetical protein
LNVSSAIGTSTTRNTIDSAMQISTGRHRFRNLPAT